MAPLVGKQDADRAFERLYRRHVTNVYRYSLAMLGEPAEAEDVTQTTFLNAYRAFQRGDRPEKAENWLIAIAHNVCRQRFRQQKRRPAEVELVDEVVAARELDDREPSLEELRRALAALPAKYRAALVMRELEGASYGEIAARLGITVPALESLIFRARAALREHLEEQLSCREIGLAISKQMDGVLPLAEQRALRAHLRRCPDCALLARRQRAQRKTLKTLLLVPLPLSLNTFPLHAVNAGAAIASSAKAAIGGSTGSVAASASGAASAGSAVASGSTATAGLAVVGGSTASTGSMVAVGASAAGGVTLAAKAATVVVAAALLGGGAYEGINYVPHLVRTQSRPAHGGPTRSHAHNQNTHLANAHALHGRVHGHPTGTRAVGVNQAPRGRPASRPVTKLHLKATHPARPRSQRLTSAKPHRTLATSPQRLLPRTRPTAAPTSHPQLPRRALGRAHSQTNQRSTAAN